MLSDDTLRRLQLALDQLEIQKVISLYAQGQDRHQRGDNDVLAQWDQVFTPDAVMDYSMAGVPPMTYKELAVWMRGSEGKPGRMNDFAAWQHMLSLPVIEIEGDVALARTDFLAMHKCKDGPLMNGRYDALGAFVDRLIRTDAGWRIQKRRVEAYFATLSAITDMDSRLQKN